MVRGARDRSDPPPAGVRDPLLVGGLLIGIGLAGTLDEVLLHQLLQWHHLYDRGTPRMGILSDGLFHLASTAVLVLGVVIALGSTGGAVRRARSEPADASDAGRGRRLLGAVLVGTGGFNLYDATVQHKLLRLHQVRADTDNLLPYDLGFGGVALALCLVGLALLRGSRASAADDGAPAVRR
jgi:uncharacterized membrane protein